MAKKGAKTTEPAAKGANKTAAAEARKGLVKAKSPKKGDKKAQAGSAQAGLGAKITQLKDFFEESKVEIKKVTWPSRKETVTTSIAVVVLVFVMSIFLGVMDLALGKLVQLILS